MDGLLEAALRFTVTKAALRDFSRAEMLAGNGGLAPSPVTLLRSARTMLSRASKTPGAARWLADLLPQEAAEILRSSSWYQKNSAVPPLPPFSPAREGEFPGLPGLPAVFDLGGLRFQGLPGGSFIMGGGFPYPAQVEGFWIAAGEVSPESWGAFLGANPQWKPENAGSLAEQGLAGEDYLGDVPFAPPGGVSGVSWYAAEAYCRWLTGLLPLDMADYEARLPLETEWEYAAKHAGSWGLSLEGLLGSRWEWCGDPYAPLGFFSAREEYIRIVSSPERSLRGGAWINPAGSVGVETRASLPPSACSAFVSFRPVIALRKAP
jgi:hypothetical protein